MELKTAPERVPSHRAAVWAEAPRVGLEPTLELENPNGRSRTVRYGSVEFPRVPRVVGGGGVRCVPNCPSPCRYVQRAFSHTWRRRARADAAPHIHPTTGPQRAIREHVVKLTSVTPTPTSPKLFRVAFDDGSSATVPASAMPEYRRLQSAVLAASGRHYVDPELEAMPWNERCVLWGLRVQGMLEEKPQVRPAGRQRRRTPLSDRLVVAERLRSILADREVQREEVMKAIEPWRVAPSAVLTIAKGLGVQFKRRGGPGSQRQFWTMPAA